MPPDGQSARTTSSSSSTSTNSTVRRSSPLLELTIVRRVSLPPTFVAVAGVAAGGRLFLVGSAGQEAEVVSLALTSSPVGQPVALGVGVPTGIVSNGSSLWLSVGATGGTTSVTGFVTEVSIPGLHTLRTLHLASPLGLATDGAAPVLLYGGSAGGTLSLVELPSLRSVATTVPSGAAPVPGQPLASCGAGLLVAFIGGTTEKVMSVGGGPSRSWRVPTAGDTTLACADGSPIVSVATAGGGTYVLRDGTFVRVRSSSDFGHDLTFADDYLFTTLEGDSGPLLQAFLPTVSGVPTAELALPGAGAPGAILCSTSDGLWVSSGSIIEELRAQLAG